MRREGSSKPGRGWRKRARTVMVQWALLVTLGVAMGLNLAHAEDPAWQPVGPYGATVFALTRDPGNPDVLYAGTFFGGLYRSTDGGAQWSHLASDFSDASVFGVAVDPTNPSRLYAATFNHGLHRSLDGGASWSAANEGFTPPTAQDVAVDPNDPDTVLAASASGVFRSTDGATSWSPVGGVLADVAVRNLLFVPGVPGLVFAGSSGVGVFRSTDGGQTWSDFSTGLGAQNVTALSYDPASDTLYATTSLGAFRRTTQAAAWSDISFNLAGAKFNYILPGAAAPLAATDSATWRLGAGGASWEQWSEAQTQLLSRHPQSGRVHIAGIFGAFLYSDDDGATFENAVGGIQNRFVGAIETLDFDGLPLIYAGSDVGVEMAAERYREDPAPPWFSLFPMPGALFDITAHPTIPGRLYAGSERVGVWRSDWWGLYWEPASDGIVPARILGLDQAPTLANPLYAATSSGVFVSYDDGVNWITRTVSDSAPQVTAIAADPERPGHAYSGTDDGRIFRTINFGDNFIPTWQEPDGAAIVAIEASRFFNIYAITATGKLYTSDDIGINFFARAAEITHPILSVAVDPERPWIVYVGTAFGGVYKSESNAIEWQQKSSGIDVPFVFSLLVDPDNSSVVYAGAEGVVYRSGNGGESWAALAGSLPQGFVSDLELDSATGTLYASVDGHGIYESVDGGASWVQVLAGAGGSSRMPLALSEVTAGGLFAGSLGAGVQRSTDGATTWAPSNEGMGLFVRSIAIDPDNPDTMYATSIGAGVFKSTDGGDSWSPQGIEDGNLFKVFVDRQASSTVYVGTTEGLARSDDAGANWSNVAFRAPFVFDTFVDPNAADTLYAVAAEAKVFRSTSGGETWDQLTRNGLPEDNLLSGTVHPVSGDIYVGSENFGVFRLSPGSDHWESLGPPGLPVETKITDIEIPPSGFVRLPGDDRWGLLWQPRWRQQLDTHERGHYQPDRSDHAGQPVRGLRAAGRGVQHRCRVTRLVPLYRRRRELDRCGRLRRHRRDRAGLFPARAGLGARRRRGRAGALGRRWSHLDGGTVRLWRRAPGRLRSQCKRHAVRGQHQCRGLRVA